MAVTVRQRKTKNGMYWQADIRLRLPDGSFHRERPKTPGATRTQALRWARQREAHIIRNGLQRKETRKGNTEVNSVPKFKDFVERFMIEHVDANGFTPSTRRSYEVGLRNHLLPLFGELSLDEIGPEHVQALKRRKLAPSTTNGTLDQLKTILRRAKCWGLVSDIPQITRVKQGKRQPEFYDFDEYDQLVAAAVEQSPIAHALVLLGGDAGLRRGELRGLRWPNVYLDRESVYVVDNFTCSDPIRLPKGGKARWVPLTEPLMHALSSLERRGEFVLCHRDGRHLGERTLDRYLMLAQKRAGLKVKGPHILRHTFCSHLAMRGTPQKAIQELAGHAHSSTTEIYMHLAPRALKEAIKNLRPSLGHNPGSAVTRDGKPKKKQ